MEDGKRKYGWSLVEWLCGDIRCCFEGSVTRTARVGVHAPLREKGNGPRAILQVDCLIGLKVHLEAEVFGNRQASRLIGSF